jgi:hypothetical protein
MQPKATGTVQKRPWVMANQYSLKVFFHPLQHPTVVLEGLQHSGWPLVSAEQQAASAIDAALEAARAVALKFRRGSSSFSTPN